MNIINDGLIKILKEFSELKPKWDGYNGKKIYKKTLNKLRDMNYLIEIMKKFRAVGFNEVDIDISPTPEGFVQFEAENKTTYLEVTIMEK